MRVCVNPGHRISKDRGETERLHGKELLVTQFPMMFEFQAVVAQLLAAFVG